VTLKGHALNTVDYTWH